MSGGWDRREFTARYPGKCHICSRPYEIGGTISLVVAGAGRGYRGGNKYAHRACVTTHPPFDQRPVEPRETPAEYKATQMSTQELAQEVAEPMPDNLADMIAEAIQSRIKAPAIDENRVKEIAVEQANKVVEANADRFRPRVIEVKIPERVESVRIEGAHYLLPRLINVMAAGLPVYLWGPAGGGKSTAALQAATALQRSHELDTLDPSTFRSMVQGYCTPTGEPVHTSFTRAWVNGHVYIAEECDNAPGHVQTLFNTALANGHAPLAWGNAARKDGFGFVANGNTPGRPTQEFPDRRPMSGAFRDRMYFIHWPIDPSIECRAAGLAEVPAPTREVKTCTPAKWVTWVMKMRAWTVANAPTIVVTPRASLDGIKALAAGETPEEVAHGLVFRGADSAMVDKALAAVRLP